jgi:hypothetical protein
MSVRSVLASIFLAVTLAACAEQAPAPPPACEPDKQMRDPATALPGSDYASNIQTLLYGEWDRFGRQSWRYAAGNANGTETRHGLREEERPDWVKAYWRSVSRFITTEEVVSQPWSAVFVSWVMIQAGVPTASFCGHPSHAAYLETIWKNQQRDANAPFILRHPGESRPLPGDLVCAARRPSTGAPVSEIALGRFRRPDGLFLASHCDIVVRVDPRRHLLEAIGGNVADSVTMSVFDLDADGRLAEPTDRNGEARPWFGVVENRYARRPRTH